MVVELDTARVEKVAKAMTAVVQDHLAEGPDSPLTVFEILNAAAWVVSTILTAANGGPAKAEAFFLDTLKEHVEDGPQKRFLSNP